jgi:dihydropteroate synthase
MGILNVTPDSFSDGGAFIRVDAAVAQARRMLDEGAAILDVGGESTRPGSDPVSADEERRRVVPVVEAVLRANPEAVVSVDTYRASTAEAALEAGAAIVNDITALGDPRMAPLVAERGVPVVLMHMLGRPKTMQENPRYASDVVREVREFLARRAEVAIAAGVSEGNIVLDPGIGFGKTLRHNLLLLRRLDEIAALGHPVLVGTSRKGFLGKLTGAKEPRDRLFGTVATTVLAYEKGAKIFRVHDVRPNAEALAVAAAVRNA